MAPRREEKKERRNSERPQGYKVLTDEERKKAKEIASKIQDALLFGRSEKKEEEQPKDWFSQIFS